MKIPDSTMNIIKGVHISLAVALIMLGTPSLVFASVIEYGEESEEEEECKEENKDMKGLYDYST